MEFYPKSAPSFVMLSRVRAAMHDAESAIELAEKALALDPKSAEARKQLDSVKTR